MSPLAGSHVDLHHPAILLLPHTTQPVGIKSGSCLRFLHQVTEGSRGGALGENLQGEAREREANAANWPHCLPMPSIPPHWQHQDAMCVHCYAQSTHSSSEQQGRASTPSTSSAVVGLRVFSSWASRNKPHCALGGHSSVRGSQGLTWTVGSSQASAPPR